MTNETKTSIDLLALHKKREKKMTLFEAFFLLAGKEM